MHKQSATRLRDENDVLRRENETLMGPLIREKDQEIEKWKLENASLFERIAALENQNSELTIEVHRLKESDTQKSVKIDDLLAEISTVKNERKQSDEENSRKVTKLEEKLRINQSHFEAEKALFQKGNFLLKKYY